jgi:thiol-disulfide isomerase/thioredoxin
VRALIGLVLFTASAHARTPLSSGEIDALEFVSFDGLALRMNELRRRVTVVNVWTDSCPPCLKELPQLQKLADAYKGDLDVAILTLTFDPSGEHPQTPSEKAKTVAKQLGLKMPILWDRKFQFMKLSQKQDVAFPTTFLIDAKGRVQEKAGYEKQSDEEFVRMWRTQIEAAKK